MLARLTASMTENPVILAFRLRVILRPALSLFVAWSMRGA